FLMLFFFFQAEDGIRDRTVTGVQTCALPISDLLQRVRRGAGPFRIPAAQFSDPFVIQPVMEPRKLPGRADRFRLLADVTFPSAEIGRASCRERLDISVVAVRRQIERSGTRPR